MPVIKGKPFVVGAGRFRLQLGKRTLIMGIINLTADSFSGDGLLKNNLNCSLAMGEALAVARRMKACGADIIDLGAESTRPGSQSMSVKEELSRVIPLVKRMSQCLAIPISVDTYKPQVAQEAIEAGASIINHIMTSDKEATREIASCCARKKRALILMHIRGRPFNMQELTNYRSLIAEIKSELKRAIRIALKAGLPFKNIIIDPGIGFAKTARQNLEILRHLSEFATLKRPLLVGVSRKSFIGKVLNLDVDKRIFGSAASVALAIAGGAHMVRVHDVAEMYQVVKMTDAIVDPSRLRVR